MLREYGRIRVRETGMYGTIVDWKSGDDHCEVELDGWQHEGQIDGDRQFPYPFAVSDLEELIEVDETDRRALFDAFDTLVISSFCYMTFPDSPTIVVRRMDDGVQAIVHSWDFETNKAVAVEGSDATKLLSAVFATHADRWVESFEPDCCVLDGYSWTLSIYSGNRYFECKGENAVPDELVELLYAVHEVGLPLAWNGYEILVPHVMGDDE